MSASAPVQVNISSLTIVKVVLVVLGLVLLWTIREIVAMIIVSWMLSMALHPWVDRLQRWHIPRAVGILSVYVAALAVATGVVILFVPLVTTELASIPQNFPKSQKHTS